MNDERFCRVLIVDNELDYAAQTASKLEEIRPSLLNNNRLKIELTNNAYFAADKLRQCRVDQPPWDIIIADVYMPFPSRESEPEIAETDLDQGEFSYRERTWPCWQYPYNKKAALEEEVKQGGFRVAETIATRLDAGEGMSDLKLILMSNCLFGKEREHLLAYEKSNKTWFRYYDKADWERNNLSEWPTRQVDPDIFKWSLYVAIRERQTKDWGTLIYENIPDVQAIIGTTVSLEMNNIIREAWRLGGGIDIETILISGEVGTGREVFAKLIHNLRMRSLHAAGEFVGIDCSSISHDAFEKELLDYIEESAGGTLFIDEVDKLTPPHQCRLYHLLKDKRIRGVDRMQTVDFAAHLAICTASGRNLEELNLNGLFNDDLYYLLKDEQLHIPPLRKRPQDAVSVAEVIAQQAVSDIKLSDDAREWIETYHWPGNNKELRSVITTAARRALTSVLTADDLEGVVKRGRREPAATRRAESIPGDEPQQTRNFRAEPPFQLHWGENLLIDGKKRPIPLADDLYRVLKELLRPEEGQHDFIRGRLTFAQMAELYKDKYDEDHTERTARRFVQNLRRFLKKYGVDHHGLIQTWKGHGYLMGTDWDDPPAIYASEPSLLQMDDIEEAEDNRFYRKGSRRKKYTPDS
jgi:hypothetical protein